MKYIIVEVHEIPIAIIFDELVQHNEVAGDKKVISAGFCNREGQAYGKSVSLNLSSRDEDSKIIQKSMGRHC